MKQVWKVEVHTSPLGDTGDYMSEIILTNGYISFYCNNEDIEVQEIQEICDKLNKKPNIMNSNEDNSNYRGLWTLIIVWSLILAFILTTCNGCVSEQPQLGVYARTDHNGRWHYVREADPGCIVRIYNIGNNTYYENGFWFPISDDTITIAKKSYNKKGAKK